jgi:hypothetical protein
MSDRLTPARIARSFHQGVTGTRRTARRAATGGLIAAFLLSIVGPAAVMASPVAVAVNDVYSVAKNVTLTESSDTGVLSNDEFSGHAKLVLSPGHGFLDLSTNGAFTYEPNADFVGTDTFTYQACVDPSSCNPTPATVTITVANTAPVTVDDVLSVSEDSDATAIDVMDNDTDDNGDALHFAAIYQPLNGLVTTVGSGSAAYLRYTPDADFHGIDTFNYTVSDSNLNSELGTVTVTVGAVNDLGHQHLVRPLRGGRDLVRRHERQPRPLCDPAGHLIERHPDLQPCPERQRLGGRLGHGRGRLRYRQRWRRHRQHRRLHDQRRRHQRCTLLLRRHRVPGRGRRHHRQPHRSVHRRRQCVVVLRDRQRRRGHA